MRFCPNCGAQITDTAKFCTECGMKTPVDEVQQKTVAPKNEESCVKTPYYVAPPVQENGRRNLVEEVLIDTSSAKTAVMPQKAAANTPPSPQRKAKQKKGASTALLIVAVMVALAAIAVLVFALMGANAETFADQEETLTDTETEDPAEEEETAKPEETEKPEEQKKPDSSEMPEKPDKPEKPEKPDVPEEKVEPEEPEMLDGPSMIPPGEVFEPVVSVNWPACTVEIIGAEQFEDVDGKSAIRFYYDFTNDSEEIVFAKMVLGFDVTQDGYDQNVTCAFYDQAAPEYDNDFRYLRPGATIRCCGEYRMKEDGGPVVVKIYDYENPEYEITAEFDPANLPGRPMEDWEPVPISDPQWLDGWSDRGTYRDDYEVFIDNAELAIGENGENLIRIYYEFTNNSSKPTSFGWEVTQRVFQDGVSLVEGYTTEDVNVDGNNIMDIAPGETIRVAYCYVLISTSPVEVELIDEMTGPTGIGVIYEIDSE